MASNPSASRNPALDGHHVHESQRDSATKLRVASAQVISGGAGAGGTNEGSRWEAPLRGAHPPVQVGKRPAPRRGAWREMASIHAPCWGAMRRGSSARWVRLSLRSRLPTGYLHWPLRGRGTPSPRSLLPAPPKPTRNKKDGTPLGFCLIRSLSQGSSFLATLGFGTQSLWDWWTLAQRLICAPPSTDPSPWVHSILLHLAGASH